MELKDIYSLQTFIQLLTEAKKVNMLCDSNIKETLLAFRMELPPENKKFLKSCDINTLYYLGDELQDPLQKAKLCKLLDDSGN